MVEFSHRMSKDLVSLLRSSTKKKEYIYRDYVPGMRGSEHGEKMWNNGNILKLDRGGSYTTLKIC